LTVQCSGPVCVRDRPSSAISAPIPAGGGRLEPGAAFASVVQWHCDRLGAIAGVLAPFGIRLGLEVIGVASSRTGRGQPFVTRLADLDQVLASLWNQAPNLGIILDAWHLYAAGESALIALRSGSPQVVWIHVADLPAGAPREPTAMIDSDRGLPGENGAIDSKSLLQQAKQAGYDGPVTVEPMAGCRSLAHLSPPMIAGRARAALRAIWPPAGAGESASVRS
jgi:sugar phosphate isomerase/epimerase